MLQNNKMLSIMLLLSIFEMNKVHAESPINIGSQKQLFIDKLFIKNSNGISLKIQQPRKTKETILKPEHEWESASLNWFNILTDQGVIDKKAKYRMWYETYDIDGWPTGDDTSFCYAESRNGIHWTKPELGLFSYKGSTRNNILFRQIGSKKAGSLSRVHGTNIFIDQNASKNSRYKAVGQGIFQNFGKPPHRMAGMYSEDGLKWTRYDKPICNIFADSQYSGFWDESINKYVIYGRVSGRGRALGRTEGNDFENFKPLELVLQSNENDPPNSDLYNSAAMKYPHAHKIYFMFPSLYQHGPDTLDIRLAVSRDGIHWSRPDQKTPWIEQGKPGEFDSGTMYMGQGVIRSGDELWFYYSGSPLKHNEANLENLAKPRNKRTFSRVVLKLDRFVCAAAGNNVGSFTTPLLNFNGKTLKLNQKVHQGGSIRVELLDKNNQSIKGHTLDDCIPLAGDSLSATVKWKNGTDISFRAGIPTRFRIVMTNAEIFSFQTVF